MGYVGSIIIGLLLGIIAKLLLPTFKDGLFKITETLGCLGAVAAYEIGILAGLYRNHEPIGYLAPIIGAAIVLEAYRWVIVRRLNVRRTKLN